MNFSIKDFLRKCDQIHSLRSFLQIWSQLLKKSLMKNFIFCAVKKKNKHLTMDDIYRYCKNCFTPTEKDQVYQKKM